MSVPPDGMISDAAKGMRHRRRRSKAPGKRRITMKHRVWPYEEPLNAPTFDGNSAPTAIELHFPESFSGRAWHMIDYLGDTIALYLFKDRFIATDEGCELAQPRWAGDSLDELEGWLEGQATIKDAEEPGWEEPFKSASDDPANGVRKEIFAASYKEALRVAKNRGYERIEFTSTGLKYDIDEYLKENEGDPDMDEADYTLFGDVIVRIGDAWGKEADVTQMMY